MKKLAWKQPLPETPGEFATIVRLSIHRACDKRKQSTLSMNKRDFVTRFLGPATVENLDHDRLTKRNSALDLVEIKENITFRRQFKNLFVSVERNWRNVRQLSVFSHIVFLDLCNAGM
jgi:hypothetical protein